MTFVYTKLCPLVTKASWWRYEMLSAIVLLGEVKPPVTGWFQHKRSAMWSYGVFFDISQKKHMKKQSSCRGFETPWSPFNVTAIKLSRQEKGETQDNDNKSITSTFAFQRKQFLVTPKWLESGWISSNEINLSKIEQIYDGLRKVNHFVFIL